MDAAAQRTTLEVIELKAELDRRSETPQWVWCVVDRGCAFSNKHTHTQKQHTFAKRVL